MNNREVVAKLAAVADKLDSIDSHKEADALTEVMKRVAEYYPDWGGGDERRREYPNGGNEYFNDAGEPRMDAASMRREQMADYEAMMDRDFDDDGRDYPGGDGGDYWDELDIYEDEKYWWSELAKSHPEEYSKLMSMGFAPGSFTEILKKKMKDGALEGRPDDSADVFHAMMEDVLNGGTGDVAYGGEQFYPEHEQREDFGWGGDERIFGE